MGLLTFAGAVGLIVFVSALITYKRHNQTSESLPQDPLAPKTVSLPQECRELIKGAILGPKRGLLLQTRASPNQRLHKWFGINNAFTNPDQAVSRRFVHSAQKLIGLSGDEWSDVLETSRQHVEQEVILASSAPDNSNEATIKLIPMTQVLTLRIVLYLIHWKDPENTQQPTSDLARLRVFAEAINTSWLSSKDAIVPDSEIDSSRLDLRRKLNEALPNHSREESDSPINFILPAYETMWRAALLCLVKIRERNYSSTTKNKRALWIGLLLAFIKSPTSPQLNRNFEDLAGSDSPVETAAMLTKEALRLYPPTRRIYRDFTVDPKSSEGTLCAADIETCHRDNLNFRGTDEEGYLDRFWPARWAQLADGVEKNNFLAFGAPPLICPAREEFGYMMIALIVGTLLEKFGDEWIFTVPADELADVRNVGKPLKTGRKDYGGFAFECKSQVA